MRATWGFSSSTDRRVGRWSRSTLRVKASTDVRTGPFGTNLREANLFDCLHEESRFSPWGHASVSEGLFALCLLEYVAFYPSNLYILVDTRARFARFILRFQQCVSSRRAGRARRDLGCAHGFRLPTPSFAQAEFLRGQGSARIGVCAQLLTVNAELRLG